MHGSKFKQCGFDELMTCRDQPPIGNYSTRQPRAAYQVYAAYGNTSGLMVEVDRHCGDADGFASYDANSTHESSSGGTASAWVRFTYRAFLACFCQIARPSQTSSVTHAGLTSSCCGVAT
jgi:hypothetical protein